MCLAESASKLWSHVCKQGTVLLTLFCFCKCQFCSGTTCLQEGVDSLSSVGTSAYSHFLIHEVEAVPAAAAAVWPKHGMRAQDVHLHKT